MTTKNDLRDQLEEDIFKSFGRRNKIGEVTTDCRIIKTEDGKLMKLPVLGFSEADLEVYQDSIGLVVEGTAPEITEEIQKEGYQVEDFKKTFIIEGLEVTEVELKEGLLNISLKRTEPERVTHNIKTSK